jgi:hypothetical protein
LGKLSENGENFLKNMLFLQFGGKLTKNIGACPSDHGLILIAKLDELLSQLLLLSACSRVAVLEQVAT